MLTSLPKHDFAKAIKKVVSPVATVNDDCDLMPSGFRFPDEAQLGKTESFLSDIQRRELKSWWLAENPEKTRLPNWDIIIKCLIKDKQGLILVEGKSHEDEFKVKNDNCNSESLKNRNKIAEQIKTISELLNNNAGTKFSGWALSHRDCYQLSNRFAWAWKVASFGIPVVLIYLGFLNAEEMENGNRVVLKSDEQWQRCVRSRSAGIIPPEAWDGKIMVENTPIFPIIRSLDVNICASSHR